MLSKIQPQSEDYKASDSNNFSVESSTVAEVLQGVA